MRFISKEEFNSRELHNGEEYVLRCEIGAPLTYNERQAIINQIHSDTNRFQVVDEWTGEDYSYYLKIRVINNLIVGLAVILVLSTIFVIAVGYSLGDLVHEVGISTTRAIPIGLIVLAIFVIYYGYRWKTARRD